MDRRSMRAVVMVSAVLALGACRAVLGIDEDVPLLPDGADGGPGGGDGATGDGAGGDASSDGASTDAAEDGGTVPVDRRYAVWPLPDPRPLLSNYDLTPDTVTDKTTGLVWQRQEPTPVSASYSAASTYCDDLDLAGKQDWRLPTRIELLTILDYGQPSNVLNKTVFPDSPQAGGTIAWTSSLSLLRAKLTDRFLVDLDLALVTLSGNDQLSNLYRCVRGGPTTSPANRYAVTAETARDVRTGVTWQRKAFPGIQGFDAAKASCAALSIEGASGWRLPTVRELVTLIDEAREVVPMVPTIFDAGPKARYWSQTIRANPATAAYAVDMDTANVHQEQIASAEMAVRCVR
ncbi:MAG: DUF1566 domain-containing protein [Deltaproteobacteria bacterium]|nr:DUF1566 domain-containing protein [Deltaproteobacteria bacterium]